MLSRHFARRGPTIGVVMDFLGPRLYSSTASQAPRLAKPRGPTVPSKPSGRPPLKHVELDDGYRIPIPQLVRPNLAQRIDNLRAALAKNSLIEACREFNLMKAEDLLQYIRTYECQTLASFLMTVIPKVGGVRAPTDQPKLLAARKKALEDIREFALFLDSHGESEPLLECLLIAFRDGEFDVVLQSWERMLQTFHERGMAIRKHREELKLATTKKKETESALGSAADGLSPPNPPPAARPFVRLTDNFPRRHVQTLVISIYALKQDADAAMRQIHRTEVPLLSQEDMEKFIPPLVGPENLSSVLGLWDKAIAVDRIFRQDKRGLHHMFNERNVGEAWRHYQILMDAVSSSQLTVLAQDSTEDGQPSSSPGGKFHIGPTTWSKFYIGPTIWSKFLAGFVNCQKIDLARKVWDDMLSLGVIPTKNQWNIILDGYGKHGDIDKMVEIWDDMKAKGVEQDAYSCTAIISAFFQAGLADRGLDAFEQVKLALGGKDSEGVTTTSGLPLVTCNATVHGLLSCHLPEDAARILAGMHRDGPQPDSATYNSLLRHHSRTNNEEAFLSTIRTMEEKDIPRDAFTYTTLLDFIRKRNPSWESAVQEMLNTMQTLGATVSDATFTAIVDGLVRRRGEENIRAAIKILDAMEAQNMGNEVVYTSIIAGIKRDPSIAPELADTLFRDIISRMEARGLEPNSVTINFLVEACLERKDHAGLEQAMSYWRSMKREHIPEQTYFVMLSGLLKRREYAHLAEVLRRMRSDKFEPRGATAKLIARITRLAQLGQLGSELNHMFSYSPVLH